MSADDDREYQRLLAENERYAEAFDRSRLTARPLAAVAVLTCMDTRMNVEDILGLRAGDANILRNAGAVATDDAIRSLVLSQRMLGTRGVIVLGHTGCGLHNLADDELRKHLSESTGHRADVSFGTFVDLDEHVRSQVQRIRDHAWTMDVPVHGLVYDVLSGRVREVA